MINRRTATPATPREYLYKYHQMAARDLDYQGGCCQLVSARLVELNWIVIRRVQSQDVRVTSMPLDAKRTSLFTSSKVGSIMIS